MVEPFLSVKQCATLLGIRTHGVLSLINSGELRAVDVSLHPGGRPRWRIMAEDFDGFISRRMKRPPERRTRQPKTTTAIKRHFR